MDAGSAAHLNCPLRLRSGHPPRRVEELRAADLAEVVAIVERLSSGYEVPYVNRQLDAINNEAIEEAEEAEVPASKMASIPDRFDESLARSWGQVLAGDVFAGVRLRW